MLRRCTKEEEKILMRLKKIQQHQQKQIPPCIEWVPWMDGWLNEWMDIYLVLVGWAKVVRKKIFKMYDVKIWKKCGWVVDMLLES